MADDIEVKKKMLNSELDKVNIEIDQLADKFNGVLVSSDDDFKQWKATRTSRNKMLDEAQGLYAVKDYLMNEIAQLEQSNLEDFDEDDEEMEDDED